MLPDAGYQFQLGKEVTDSTLWEERDKLTKFISTLSQSGEVTTTQEQKVLTMENVSLQKFVKKKKKYFPECYYVECSQKHLLLPVNWR